MDDLLNEIFWQPFKVNNLAVYWLHDQRPIAHLGSQFLATAKENILYEKEPVGIMLYDPHGCQKKNIEEMSRLFSPLLFQWNQRGKKTMQLLNLLWGIKKSRPEIFDWVGIYFKSSYLFNDPRQKDLLLGPFIGPATEHVRIPIDRGFCGMALREERTVNVADVRSRPEYIACSLAVRSEIVIPLKNQAGEYVAELDIDSERPAAFTTEVEKELVLWGQRLAEFF
jgi:L-methionine (R)-S-oxide reductase